MNKKGFTLIELSISIALLSLIMAFLFNFLLTIRKNEDGVKDDTEMVILRNTISKYLNEEVRNNNRISSYSCCQGYTCNYTCTSTSDNVMISFDNSKKKKISLIKNSEGIYDTIQYEDITDTNNIIVELKKKLPSKYAFDPIELNMLEVSYYRMFNIKIPIQLHKEYDIEIVDTINYG